MKITGLTFKKQIVLMDTEDGSALAADPSYIMKEAVKVGDELDFGAFMRFNYDFLYQTAMDSALNYLSYAARTEKQIKDHLAKKKIASPVIKDVLDKLKSYRYADDDAFAANYVSLGADAKKGRLYLKRKLKEKGVPDDTIGQSLELYDEQTEAQNARSFIEKQNGLLKQFPPRVRKEKIARKAAAQGYAFDVIAEVMNELVTDHEDGSYDDYFIKRIDKKCSEYVKKGLTEKQAKAKLYAAFLAAGASKALIDERYAASVSENHNAEEMGL